MHSTATFLRWARLRKQAETYRRLISHVNEFPSIVSRPVTASFTADVRNEFMSQRSFSPLLAVLIAAVWLAACSSEQRATATLRESPNNGTVESSVTCTTDGESATLTVTPKAELDVTGSYEIEIVTDRDLAALYKTASTDFSLCRRFRLPLPGTHATNRPISTRGRVDSFDHLKSVDLVDTAIDGGQFPELETKFSRDALRRRVRRADHCDEFAIK
ncbi:MAG: hypothetical protein ACJAXA_000438 [Candidatus Aldehydirespiratoraceae bacterium]